MQLYRFDQVSENNHDEKKDPVLPKQDHPGAVIVQMLLAAAAGDVEFLRRYNIFTPITIRSNLKIGLV